MSLFPAYSGNSSADNPCSNAAKPEDLVGSWLQNSSFEPVILKDAENVVNPKPTDVFIDVDELPSPKGNTDSIDVDELPSPDHHSKNSSTAQSSKHRKSKKSSDKHKKKKRKHRDSPVPETVLFTGNEEYYVDKKSERGFLHVQTLHRPACPKYRTYLRSLGVIPRSNRGTSSIRRYFLKGKRDKITVGDRDDIERLDEEDFINKNRTFNKSLGENPGDVSLWLDFVRHQDHTPQKVTKLQIAERKIEILDKALRENVGNDQLYEMYVTVIDRAYPSFEVSKILDGLLAKDPTNYTLWIAQVLASQGSMARCIVPDVLKLYEQCMKHMYNRTRYDTVMLKLFSSCCFFLRQAALFEQLFALIKLALELNVCANKFQKIQPLEQDQHTLVEYEEVVLASGLPMNEIWLRIEKLRQNFYFLPCPEGRSCPDPQRIVFNEDIVHFVYPLSQKSFVFDLIVRILHLLKVPLPIQPHDHTSHFDAIEEVLAVLLFKPFLECTTFDAILVHLVRDFSSGPSFVRTHIGHEIYTNILTEFLLLFAETMPEHRVIFVRLWMRFERILLCQERLLHGQVPTDRAKKLRSQIKSLLKCDENRNELIFYTEYAMIECELGDLAKMDAIFQAAIAQAESRNEMALSCVCFAESLMRRKQFPKACAVLASLVIECDSTETESIPEYRKLQARKALADKCKECVESVRELSEMSLAERFSECAVFIWMKAKVYFHVITASKNEAVQEMEVLLRSVPEQTDLHRFLRERLFELYADVLQMVDRRGHTSNLLMFGVLRRALEEFPNNLVLVRFAATLEGQTWFRIRSLLTRAPSSVSVVFLVAAAKYRYSRYQESFSGRTTHNDFGTLSSDIDVNETTFKTRVCNLLQCVTGKNSVLRKNALLWRIYLRSLLDVNKNFEQSRNALFGALDECPWNKDLYMDGSVYVPQELTHIQDLIIEKQLRIYALPEELEILRTVEIPNEPKTSGSIT